MVVLRSLASRRRRIYVRNGPRLMGTKRLDGELGGQRMEHV